MPDDLCDLCMSSGVTVERTTYCGKTIGIECGCAEANEDGTCGDPRCEECEPDYENHYMHCGVTWTDEWQCMCNDECPKCKAEIEPYKSYDLRDDELIYHVDKNWVPEGGWPEGCHSRED